MSKPVNPWPTIAAILLMAVATAVSAGGRPYRYSGQTYEQLITPPPDSAEAANVRIWLALERSNVCRVSVQILDRAGNVIRNVFDGLLPGGYYNLYWDKKNDLGRYVDAGSYTYNVEDGCSDPRKGEVRAVYTRWERACLFYSSPGESQPEIEYELTRDSVPVSLQVLHSDTLFRVVFRDSLMSRGRYGFSLASDSTFPSGRYLIKLTVGDMIHAAYVWLER